MAADLWPTTSLAAVRIGQELARKVFARRGNHTEAHLREHELAALLALAAQLGRPAICDRCGSAKPVGQSCDCFDNNCQ